MVSHHFVQDRNTGKLFAGLVGLRGVEWTSDKDIAYQLTRGQALKVIDKLRREQQVCQPVLVIVF